MKKIISICLGLVLVSHLGFSQKSKVKIGDNPYILNASAALEVESTSKGFLPPRMSLFQKNAISVSTATKGLTVYCTDCVPQGLYYYDGVEWNVVGSKETSVQFVNSNADVTLSPPTTTTTPVAITLPSKEGTLATLAGIETLSNKTLTAAKSVEFSGSTSGTAILAAPETPGTSTTGPPEVYTPATITLPSKSGTLATLYGTETLGNKTLTAAKSVQFSGTTSGTATLAAPLVAGTTTITLPSSSGTLATIGPLFRAYMYLKDAQGALKNQSSNITSGEYNIVNIQTEEYDTDDSFDTTIATSPTGNRFTPKKEGFYLFNAQVSINIGTGTLTRLQACLYLNGALSRRGEDTFNDSRATVTGLVYMNGTTDYMDLRAYIVGTAGISIASSASGGDTYFEGVFIRLKM